ncbi:YhdH/YhfP family quinone oxidoreductase [Metallibacterium sp.]|uniref:YhdH/YhfP family quinone oxidoreductase n=1 Tax=Metallibacterium sp. TaxID=2940281 RepID=UPI00262BA5B5|nr:YhdH/YhfP family quinone oxidoreductase [Metallibacterium sp.]
MQRDRFKAFRIHSDATGYHAGFEDLTLDQLTAGEVTVRVAWSSVNYKDALAATGQGKILRRFPLVGGIDLAGHVVDSSDTRHRASDTVLVTGCGLSETRDGGYAEFARMAANDVIPLPAGMTPRETMIHGTAGFTAGLALLRMQQNDQHPDLGPIAITGASGGVGMLAVAIFARAGYTVHAISGKPEHADFLRQLGAAEVLPRTTLPMESRPLESVRFGGALDTVGGPALAALLACCTPYGSVASCGLAASHALPTTVMPFIIRGVSLLGVASASTPRAQRLAVWQHLATDWRPHALDAIATREIAFAQLPDVFSGYLAGQAFGRTVVRVADDT